MNYTVVKDPVALRRFIEWLPDLEPGEAYYCSLFARSKYCPGLSGDKQSIKRFTSTKEFLYEKIRQLEIAEGTYMQKHKPIPQAGLALYITPNPRSYEKAAKNGLVALAHKVTSNYDGYNPHQLMLSEIQKACSRKVYADFDFDGKAVEDAYDEIASYVNLDCTTFIRTRGGFHLLVNMSKIDKEYARTWYNKISGMAGVDVRGDMLLPVVGCVQGDFMPHFVNITSAGMFSA
jgi:hypothetical protein